MVPSIQADRAVLRTLAAHEAWLQVTGGREIRDLGDCLLLLDRNDPEPYWNRLVAPDWPTERAAFHHRLDAAIVLFATLGRLPHVWTLPGDNRPGGLAPRLTTAGFQVMGSDRLMILEDPVPVGVRAAAGVPAGVTVERLHGVSEESLRGARDVAAVLADAFSVDADRRLSIEVETLAAFEGQTLHVVLARVDGFPAAVAKRSTQSGISYLSSIGTRPALRRRGLGSLVTAIAAADAVKAGSRWTYLKVELENEGAQRLYGSMGFRAVPGQIDDMLLRR